MSSNYFSIAVLGCAIPVEKLYKKQKVYHEHLHPENANFCPECGRKIETEDIFIGTQFNGKEKLGKFELVDGMCNQGDFKYIGLIAKSDEDCFYKIVDIKVLKEDLFEVFRKYNLSDCFDSFGLHTVLGWY